MSVKKGSHFRQLNYRDRLKLEDLLKEKHSVKDIAARLNVCRSTVYNEIKRGIYLRTTTELEEIPEYSADIGQKDYEFKTCVRGTGLKIDHDYELASYIENKILDDKYSPEAVIGEIKGKGLIFKTQICVKTVYNYIDKGVFARLTNKDLPVKGDKKRKYKRVRPKERQRKYGKNIEERPEMSHRETFGNWEMDTVVGPRGKSKCSLLVLTERKTRKEIIRKLTEHTMTAVVGALDKLENSMGDLFYKVFKTITVDNGTEFSDYQGMIRSVRQPEMMRTDVYYCHPYSSFERGSNENQNKLVRRHIKKKDNFDHITEREVQQIEDWMNSYPRRTFMFRTADELYQEELRQLM